MSILILGQADNEEWISIASTNVSNCSKAGRDLMLFPPILRPLAYWLLPSTKKVRKQYHQVKRIIEERSRQHRMQDLDKKDMNVLSWSQQYAKQSGQPEKYDLVHCQLYFMAISIHTVSSMLASIILDLLHHSEYIEVLRNEISSVLCLNNGLEKKSQLHQLKVMDSFMKESQRLSGTNFCKFLSPHLHRHLGWNKWSGSNSVPVL